MLAPGPVLPDSDRAHSVLLKQFCVCKLSQTFMTRLISDSIDQLLSCSVLILCGLVLVQPETINSPSFSFIPDHLAQPIRDVLLDPRGQVNLVPVLFLLSLVLVIFLISFLGCLGTCLHSRCMIFTVSFWSLFNTLIQNSPSQYFLLMVSLLISLLAVAVASLAVDKRNIIGIRFTRRKSLQQIYFGSYRELSQLHTSYVL